MQLRPAEPTVASSNSETEETMPIRGAINGIGRTGRAALRAAYERQAEIERLAGRVLAPVAA